jgi:hypothetical protein
VLDAPAKPYKIAYVLSAFHVGLPARRSPSLDRH